MTKWPFSQLCEQPVSAVRRVPMSTCCRLHALASRHCSAVLHIVHHLRASSHRVAQLAPAPISSAVAGVASTLCWKSRTTNLCHQVNHHGLRRLGSSVRLVTHWGKVLSCTLYVADSGVAHSKRGVLHASCVVLGKADAGIADCWHTGGAEGVHARDKAIRGATQCSSHQQQQQKSRLALVW